MLTPECRSLLCQAPHLGNEIILTREAGSECVVAYEGEVFPQFWSWAAELQGSGWQEQTVYIGPTFHCRVTGLPALETFFLSQAFLLSGIQF